MTRTTLAAFSILALAAPALADDLFPAPWRGNPGTTVQHWDFSGGPGGGAPDALPLNNPYGTPMLTPVGSPAWVPTFNGRSNVWSLAQGNLTFDVPNTGNTTHQKTVWLQVTYFAPVPAPGPSYSVLTAFGNPFGFVSSQVTALPNGWTHELTQWVTPVCPPAEHITIFSAGGPLLVDQVVIDTLCAVPTPGAAATLILGGLVAVRRRR